MRSSAGRFTNADILIHMEISQSAIVSWSKVPTCLSSPSGEDAVVLLKRYDNSDY